MSLLMDALKKAEKAKKKVAKNDSAVVIEKESQPPKREVAQSPVIKIVAKIPEVSVSDNQLEEPPPPQDNISQATDSDINPTVVDDVDNLEGLTLMELSDLDETIDVSLPVDNENRTSKTLTVKLKDEILSPKPDVEVEGESSVKKAHGLRGNGGNTAAINVGDGDSTDHEGNHLSPVPSLSEANPIKSAAAELTSITSIKEPEVAAALPLGKLPERDQPQEPSPHVKSARKFTTPPVVGVGANKASRRQQIWGVVGIVFLLIFGAIFSYFNSILDSDDQRTLIAVELPPVESQKAEQTMVNNPAVVDIIPIGQRPVETVIKSSVFTTAEKELPTAAIASQKKAPSIIEKQPDENNQRAVVTKPVSRTSDRSAALQITRIERRNPLEVVLQTAYQAYQEGSYKAAEDKYHQALRFDGANRDARLGLAVIAQRTGRVESARTFYKSLLALNPKDSIALTGLMSLPGGSGSKQNESRIKLMLDEEPTAAHLHFTLGIEYVAQGRWAAAQQSFFQAYRSAPGNADYSYNLAVSLEQLSQPRTALDYYRQAKQLASGQVVGFGAEQLDLRIESLSAAGKVQ